MPKQSKIKPNPCSWAKGFNYVVRVPVELQTIVGKERAFFVTKEEAETFCEDLTIRRGNLHQQAHQIPDSLALEALHCSQLLRPLNATITDATMLLLEQRKTSLAGYKISDLIAHYDSYLIGRGVSGSHLKTARSRLRPVARQFGGKLAHEITSGELMTWWGGLPVSGATKNSYRRYLKALFNFGIELRPPVLKENPVSFDLAMEDAGEVEVYTIEEMAKLLKCCPPDLIGWLTISAFAGLRPSEIMRVRWEHIHWIEGKPELEVRVKKTRSRFNRYLPIEPVLQAWLLPIKEDTGAIVDPINFRRRKDALFDKAEVISIDDGFRHSYGTYHCAAFKESSKTMDNLGHQGDPKVFELHYRKPTLQRRAMDYWGLTPETVGRTPQSLKVP